VPLLTAASARFSRSLVSRILRVERHRDRRRFRGPLLHVLPHVPVLRFSRERRLVAGDASPRVTSRVLLDQRYAIDGEGDDDGRRVATSAMLRGPAVAVARARHRRIAFLRVTVGPCCRRHRRCCSSRSEEGCREIT